jgi:hypothetical protein
MTAALCLRRHDHMCKGRSRLPPRCSCIQRRVFVLIRPRLKRITLGTTCSAMASLAAPTTACRDPMGRSNEPKGDPWLHVLTPTPGTNRSITTRQLCLPRDAGAQRALDAAIFTCSFGPLRDVCIEYARKLDMAGVPIQWHHYHDLTHGWLQMTAWSTTARDATLDVGKEVKRLRYGASSSATLLDRRYGAPNYGP